MTLTLRASLSGLKHLVLNRSVQSAMDSEVGGLQTAKSLLEA